MTATTVRYTAFDLIALAVELLTPFVRPLLDEWAVWFVPCGVEFNPAISTPVAVEVGPDAGPEIQPEQVALAHSGERVAEVARPVAPVGHVGYYPEMDEPKPEAEIEAQMSHSGKHWFLRTRLTLAESRGVKFVGVLTAGQLVPGSRLVGWREYKVTNRAFDLLSKQHRIVSESLL